MAMAAGGVLLRSGGATTGGVLTGGCGAAPIAISVPMLLASAATLKMVALLIPIRFSVSLVAPLVTVSTPPAIVAAAPGAKVNELRSIVSPATKPEMAAPIVPI